MLCHLRITSETGGREGRCGMEGEEDSSLMETSWTSLEFLCSWLDNTLCDTIFINKANKVNHYHSELCFLTYIF